jgi:uncharacterized protein YggT (Ycf19 family)
MRGRDPHRRHYPEDEPTRQRPVYRDDPYYDDPYYADSAYERDPEVVRTRQLIIYQRIASVVWFITFIIMAIITLRVVMLLINANEENAFVAWVYRTSEFFVRPFMGITEDPAFNGIVFEVNSLIAMLIYLLLIYGILQLVKVMLDLTMPTAP